MVTLVSSSVGRSLIVRLNLLRGATVLCWLAIGVVLTLRTGLGITILPVWRGISIHGRPTHISTLHFLKEQKVLTLAGPGTAEVGPPILLYHGHTAKQTGASRDEKMLASTGGKPNADAECLAATDQDDLLHAC